MSITTNIPLGTIDVGKWFSIWGRSYLILEHLENGVFVISANPAASMPFCMANDTRSNDFRKSQVREFLNGRYLRDLFNDGASDEDILETTMNLGGMVRYGADTVKVGILTLEQYVRYKKQGLLLSHVADNDWWHLATPASPDEAFGYDFAPIDTDLVWYVSKDGSCNISTSYYTKDVFPVMTLSPDLVVERIERTSLSEYTIDELLEEIKRRTH